MAQVSRYETAEGKFSSFWAPIGMLFCDAEGKPVRVKLHTLPVEDWDGWANLQPMVRGKARAPRTDVEADRSVAEGTENVEMGEIDIQLTDFTSPEA